jgi:polygalacturonase
MDASRRRLVLAGAGGIGAMAAGAANAGPLPPAGPNEARVDVRHFGAKGDGAAIDTPAINAAIDHAASRGGGVVHFPAGTYACFTIRLKSNITLHLDPGAVLLAASTPREGLASGGYDQAEPQDPAIEPYQDFGHNHWRNSMIWGEGLHDIAITGTGLLWGKGLSRGANDRDLPVAERPGVGNKLVALKNCRNVLLRDFQVLQGGHFVLLATGVDNMAIDNLLVDTNRDGFDVDCCRNVRISRCTINSPSDDAIVPKSSFALGYARPIENMTVSDCLLTGGYQMGSVLDGTWKPIKPGVVPIGRFKLGTESNGDFRNITVSNCVFDRTRGVCLLTVDGGIMEDITFSGIVMSGTYQAPWFLRLGRRMRGPAGVPMGKMRRIRVSNVTSSGAGLMPSVIAGVAGHPIQDIKISDVYLGHAGGGTRAAHVRRAPGERVLHPPCAQPGDEQCGNRAGKGRCPPRDLDGGCKRGGFLSHHGARRDSLCDEAGHWLSQLRRPLYSGCAP